MTSYLFGNSTAYPAFTVQLGISDLASLGGTYGVSVYDTGTYTDDTVWSDVTDYVRSMSTSWARSRELNRQPSNVLNVVLDNRDGRFSPGNVGAAAPYAAGGASKIRPRIAVKVEATWSAVTYPVFYGFVSNWTDNAVFGKDMTATLAAVDALSLLALHDLTGSAIGSQGDSPAVRLAAILAAASWPLTSVLDIGTNTLQVDTSTESALALVQRVAESEGGLVYADRDGAFTFHDQGRRSGGVVGTSTTGVLVGTGSKTWTTQAGLPFVVGDKILAYSASDTWKYMYLTVTAYSGTTLTATQTSMGGNGWTPTDYRITFVRSTVTQATFSAAAQPFVNPVLSQDETYFFNDITVTPQGSYSTTSTTSLAIAVASKAFTVAAGLSFVAGDTVVATSDASGYTMTGTVTTYVSTTLTVDVTAITGSGTKADWTIAVTNVARSASDSASISLYGTRSLAVSAICLNSQASALATFLLSVFSEPEYRVDEITVIPASSAAALWPLVLDARIDDRHVVTIPLPTTTYQSEISRTVHVAGISHSVSTGGGWQTTFTYSSATPYS